MTRLKHGSRVEHVNPEKLFWGNGVIEALDTNSGKCVVRWVRADPSYEASSVEWVSDLVEAGE